MTDSEQTSSSEATRGERAASVLSHLLVRSGVPAEIEVTETSERIRLDVYPESEDDAELLIGRQGRTLHAYQFVLNRIVNRFPEDRKPVNIDVSGYAKQRSTRLEQLAERLAHTTRSAGVEIRLHGMNPADRRTVHMALEQEAGVNTHSEDEGIGRKLVVTPG